MSTLSSVPKALRWIGVESLLQEDPGIPQRIQTWSVGDWNMVSWHLYFFMACKKRNQHSVDCFQRLRVDSSKPTNQVNFTEKMKVHSKSTIELVGFVNFSDFSTSYRLNMTKWFFPACSSMNVAAVRPIASMSPMSLWPQLLHRRQPLGWWWCQNSSDVGLVVFWDPKTQRHIERCLH